MSIDKLNIWYQTNCDGDWEHSYGIHLSTMDNPGWLLKIDLKDTALEGCKTEDKVNIHDDDWYNVKVENDVFIGYGSYANLNKIIDLFLFFLQVNLPLSKIEYKIYAPVLDNSKLNKFWRPFKANMIGLNKFKITNCLSMEEVNLNMRDLKDLEYIDSLDRKLDPLYEVGEIVECDLMRFFDYPGLVITNKISNKKQEG